MEALHPKLHRQYKIKMYESGSVDTKLLNVPSIQILAQNINQTLGPKYCMMNTEGYHDCASTANRFFASANLTYNIPLSKYWNELNVSLIFK